MSAATTGSGGGKAARIEKVRRQMEARGVDALLLSHGADLPWLTGYRAMPLERLTVLVLPRQGDAVLVVPGLEAARVPEGSGAFSLRPWAETEDPVAVAVALLGGRTAVLGISDRAWAGSLLAFQERLPTTAWVGASTVTSALRAVKDAEEIDQLRAAGRSADRVAEQLQKGEIPLVGRTEAAVSEEISARLLAEGHRRVNFAIVGSGPNGASPHHDAGARRIGPGEVVVCDFGGEYDNGDDVGYCSDITRTVVTGEPGAEVSEVYAVLLAAQQAAVSSVRAGVPAEEIDAVARRVIDEAGFGEYFIHRTGHGIGIEEHEDPYLVAGNRTLLAPGHAFSVEPGIYFSGRFGMRLEDIVVVGTDGPEPLNRVDHSLVLVDA
ncbi:MAG TPA: Xaa-Pro peptidase family protein [Acidimicrobiales bacterium]|nr:Xaa-Pro peptidase family protein [Acidimicrobiales bacterium]